MEGTRRVGATGSPVGPPLTYIEDDGIAKKKIFAVIILLVVNLLNYMDRFTIAGVLGSLQNYFDLNDKEAGMLQTVFIIFFMVFAPICGYLGDRYNRKFLIIGGLIVWISSVLLSTMVLREHFYAFLFLRGVVGIGEATYSTVAPTIIGDIFAGSTRSIALMVFYFAIPVGSGLGFIGGSTVALWSGSWQWGVRFTALLGVVCLILIIVGLEEPKRGQAEHAQIEPSTIVEDLKYLLNVRTYILSTVGFTSVVFCVGAASWWAPQFMTYAYGMLHKIDVVPKDEVAHISVIFGVITCCAGIVGIIAGSTIAQAWQEGSWCFTASHRAGAFVCAAGSLFAAPILFIALLVGRYSLNGAWVLLFLGVTSMCLNWAVNMDILMDVIVTHRRALATAMQTLVGHLFGDASSPYIVGFISDCMRGDRSSLSARYSALQYAMFLPTAVLILSIGCYLWATLYIVNDHHRAKVEMLVEDDWSNDVETLIPNVQTEYSDAVEGILNCYDSELRLEKVLRHLSFIRINIDHIVFPRGNPFISRLFAEGSLYGFNLEYQFPCLENVSRSLRAPVRIPAKSFTMANILFRHKRVVLLQMTPEIVPFWNQHNLVLRLHVQLNTRGKFSTRLLARCVVPLTELLIPPFLICRDFNFVAAKGMDFEGTSLIRIDLGTRESKLLEILSQLRDPLLESNYVVDGVCADRETENNIATRGHHHHLNENEPSCCPTPQHLNLQSRAKHSQPILRLMPLDASNKRITVPFRERIPSSRTEFSDSVFDDHESCDHRRSLCAVSDSRKTHVTEYRPAVRPHTSSSVRERERDSLVSKSLVQLTVHEARGLPPVLDERNRYVSPNAYVSVLGRDGELRSSICERSRRPLWNWTARFFICRERRNIIVKVLHHDMTGDLTLGFVSIPLPIEETHRADYEMVDLTGMSSSCGENPVITMSMETNTVSGHASNFAREQSRASSWSGPTDVSRGASPLVQSISKASSYADDRLVTATREELADRLRRNLEDLDRLIGALKE